MLSALSTTVPTSSLRATRFATVTTRTHFPCKLALTIKRAALTRPSYDVTNKKAPVLLSVTSYEGAAYTHQGAVLDPKNQKYLLLDDEYDEYDKVGPGIPGNPITYIWDISSLRAPKQTGLYRSGAKGVDHNQYVANGFAYQSNYGTGFRVLDVRSIPQDPTGAGVREVGFFGKLFSPPCY